jgi:hypothetical protein
MGEFEEDGANAKGYRKASARSGDHGLRRPDAISRVASSSVFEGITGCAVLEVGMSL